MATVNTGLVRALYSKACHGDGADERWKARDLIDTIALEQGLSLRALFQTAGLGSDQDLAAYFASRPISRGGK